MIGGHDAADDGRKLFDGRWEEIVSRRLKLEIHTGEDIVFTRHRNESRGRSERKFPKESSENDNGVGELSTRDAIKELLSERSSFEKSLSRGVEKRVRVLA